MARYLNANFWKKAYLLEFRNNNQLTDAFTFSVPPESEEFTFPQRKNETKTFGGAVIADYGNDLVQINLSGSTINQEVKYIYRSTLMGEELNGEQEIFRLRDLLRTYGKQVNLKGKEVYLYSLNGGGDITNNPKWWRIYVGELNISRSKDKPFCYNYKFSAIGEPEISPKFLTNFNLPSFSEQKRLLGNALNFIDSWYNMVESAVDKMEETADKIQEFGGTIIDEISGAISKVRNSIDDFNSAAKRYTDIVNGMITGATDIAYDTVQLGDKVLYSALRFYPTIIADVWNTCLATKDAFWELGEICSNLGPEYFSESSWKQIRELFDNTASDQDIADTYSTIAHDGENVANETVGATAKTLNFLGFAIIPGDSDEDDTIITCFGFKVVTITDAETSWDQIAQDYYGDATLSYIIATYNGASVDIELSAGESVLIPNLNFAESKDNNNEIYTPPDIKDNYGSDIAIVNDDFNFSNSDINVVSGVKNLEQALLNRYSTLIGARIRLEIYGIQAAIGDALKASSALIEASVHQTTVEDPRVESVEQINFEGDGDKLTVVVVYVDKNGMKQNFGGVI